MSYNHNEHVAKKQRERTSSAQDIMNSEKYWGQIVAGPADIGRRLEGSKSLKRFCEIYGSESFTLEWSDAHLKALELLQDSVQHNKRFCLSFPRGSGKSTLTQYTLVWAFLNGHSLYSVGIGATAKSAKQRLVNIKSTLRFNPLIAADYPEMVSPILFCGGESRRATGQKCNGEPTNIEWAQDKIQAATLSVPRFDWMVNNGITPAYGAIIDTASIDSEIRGKAVERPDGTMQRPTFVVADDIQTRESAKNPDIVRHREGIVKGDIMYLGGPGKQIGIAIPITVLYQDDLADRLLNHDINPEFRGIRTKMMNTMPGDGCDDELKDEIDKHWEEYDTLRRADHLAGTFHATTYYEDNHDIMTTGADATWSVRFNERKGEIDAIQHAMNLKLEDERAFYAEAQNEPLSTDTSDLPPLKPEEVAQRVLPLIRGVAPDDADMVTAFVDISRNVLWWTIVAYKSSDFTATVIDYGTWPEQNAQHFTLGTVRKKIPDVYKTHGEYTACLHAALNDCVEYIAGKTYYTDSGNEIPLKNLGIDAGWGQHAVDVYRNCKRSQYRHLVVPTKGFGVTPLKKPLVDPEKKQEPKSNIVGQWRFTPTQLRNWLLTYDTNLWKSKVNSSLRIPMGNRGATTFFGARRDKRKPDHRMFSEQICAETSAWLESGTRKVEVWTVKIKSADNHFLDCLVGCHMLAHVNGARMPNPTGRPTVPIKAPKRRKRRITI